MVILECYRCHNFFFDKIKYNDHINMKDKCEEKPVYAGREINPQCEHCGKIIVDSYKLKNHMELCKKNDPPNDPDNIIIDIINNHIEENTPKSLSSEDVENITIEILKGIFTDPSKDLENFLAKCDLYFEKNPEDLITIMLSDFTCDKANNFINLNKNKNTINELINIYKETLCDSHRCEIMEKIEYHTKYHKILHKKDMIFNLLRKLVIRDCHQFHRDIKWIYSILNVIRIIEACKTNESIDTLDILDKILIKLYCNGMPIDRYNMTNDAVKLCEMQRFLETL